MLLLLCLIYISLFVKRQKYEVFFFNLYKARIIIYHIISYIIIKIITKFTHSVTYRIIMITNVFFIIYLQHKEYNYQQLLICDRILVSRYLSDNRILFMHQTIINLHNLLVKNLLMNTKLALILLNLN